MNLLDEPWIPVLRAGYSDWVSPAQLSATDITRFDASRADFNGALAQFMIGLLQTSAPVSSRIAWRKMLDAPPDSATLAQWFEPHRAAFEFDGDCSRFMQDYELREADGEPLGISALLIEAPGENAIRNNSDLFVKRGHVGQLCPHCAAQALFTLQTNAPAGGVGYRTGLRGGGPLTTLLVADGSPAGTRSLWQTLWLNVRRQPDFLAGAEPVESAKPCLVFPWMAPMAEIQPEGGQVTPAQVHPAHVFWAMPRRIRLDLDRRAAGTCDLCGRTSQALVSRYVTRNYGLNYKGAWLHPLSPYYESKDGLLPLHPQPDGLGYRHWMAWVLGVQSERRKVARALAIAQFLDDDVEQRTGIGLRLWAFGYDMDNMKARCWYESTVPLYAVADCSRESQAALREDVGGWLAGAELAASYLRGAVRDAWFSGDARGDFSAVDATFWAKTEGAFYKLLEQRVNAARPGASFDRPALAEYWSAILRKAALQLFDREWVGSASVERMNPARVAAARRQLESFLNGSKLRTALGLESAAKKPKTTKKTTAVPSSNER